MGRDMSKLLTRERALAERQRRAEELWKAESHRLFISKGERASYKEGKKESEAEEAKRKRGPYPGPHPTQLCVEVELELPGELGEVRPWEEWRAMPMFLWWQYYWRYRTPRPQPNRYSETARAPEGEDAAQARQQGAFRRLR